MKTSFPHFCHRPDKVDLDHSENGPSWRPIRTSRRPLPPRPQRPPASARRARRPGAPGAPGVKEPMIEVSVDTLEISETNSKNFGVVWGQSGGTNQTTGQSILDANHLNFLETSVPSVFDAKQV